MSKVDTGVEAVEHTADCLSCLKIYPATRTETPHIRISVDGLMRVADMLRALRAALTAEQAKNAQARDDEWAKRLIDFAYDQGVFDKHNGRVTDHPSSLLEAFLASEQSK